MDIKLTDIAIKMLSDVAYVTFCLGVVAVFLHWLAKKFINSFSYKDRHGVWDRHENNAELLRWLIGAQILCFGFAFLSLISLAFLGGF
jgi:hypothetical protein